MLHNHLALRNYQDAALWPQCSLQFMVDRYRELYEVATQLKDLQTSTFIQNMTEQYSLINIFNRIKNIIIILNENIKSKQLDDINPLLNPQLKDDYTVGELLQKPWIQIVDRIFKLQTVLQMYNAALPRLLEKIQGKIDTNI